MSEPRLFWSTLEERARQLAAEAPADVPEPREPAPAGALSDVSRRGFLAAAGFTLAGALTGCGRAPERLSATPPTQPEELVPGRALWYASTCGGCEAGCGLLVKCRDGRPIKVEGLPEHPLSRGGLCAAGQAGVLSLYDSRRLLAPQLDGRPAAWEAVDARVRADLERVRSAGGAVRLLTGTVASLSTQAWIQDFLAAFPGARHVSVDALSWSASADAHARTHGVRALPRLRLEACEVLLGIEADLLGTGPSPVEHTQGWRAARSLAGDPPRSCHHVQVESALTLTGSNADRRHRLAPHRLSAFVAHLAARLAAKAGRSAPAAPGEPPLPVAVLEGLVERLWAARGRALVVCGLNDVDVQGLVNLANDVLAAYGPVLDLAAPARQRLGDDAALDALIGDCEAGRVGALIVAGLNPVAALAQGARLARALQKVALRVVLAAHPDETTAHAAVVLPLPHPLEAWDDAEPVDGLLSMTQPAISPLGDPRSLRACLAAWLGRPAADQDLVRAAFERDALPRLRSLSASVTASWLQTVHDGFALLTPRGSGARAFDAAGLQPVAAEAEPGPGLLGLVLTAQVGMRDGRHAHNAWLHELPDPITKAVWGNVAALAPATAGRLGLVDGDVVRLSAQGDSADLPVLAVPGLPEDTVAAALGYGRRGTDRFADVGPDWLEGVATVARGGTVGAAVEAFLVHRRGASSGSARAVRLSRTGARSPVARSQTWSTQNLPAHLAPRRGEKREMVRETLVGALGRPHVEAPHAEPGAHGAHAEPGGTLWDKPAVPGARRWGLVVDLAACTGCSACVVACQAENNVPVVGRDEVLRRRDLAWMRIDRYFADVPGAPGDVDVVHQPMLCQHCGNAPCESVCPVLATAHSAEGLNEQVYNRCVGTRYCANNCPFKVRRFNWFEYDRADPWADLALNPDVTVRSRGVMEKCSLCVQRISEGKAQAAARGTPLADGEVRTACQQSCPAGAIVFGDLADPASAVARAAQDPRRYGLLHELNLKPTVTYLSKVRHREAGAGGRHG